jgi:trimethylamine--corrinoid protein Co-methyltransferase
MRILRSFDVNEETLAFESIKEVGIGGGFYALDHTVRHMRNEICRNKGIFCGSDYARWSQAGARNAADRAHSRLQDILKSSMPLQPVLPESVLDGMRRITK